MKKIEQEFKEFMIEKLNEIFEKYPEARIEISTHDGGSTDIIQQDLEYDEFDINIYPE